MKHPVLDPRDLDAIRAQVAALARSYTPEWRYEHTEDDPGAALAELFGTMFYQIVDRFNALPEKLYTEFLNQIGFREPGPVAARGELVFTPHDTVEEPVPVRSGTQVFTADAAGEHIVYETQRSIQATPAKLLDIYYADSQSDHLQRLDLRQPQRFFSPDGEELQRHAFSIGEDRVLRLQGPGVVTMEFRQAARHLEEETTRLLTGDDLQWQYRHDGEWLPFDQVRAENGRIFLEKRNSLHLEPDESGHICVRCTGGAPLTLRLEQAALTSAPLEPCRAQNLFAGDVPILPEEGGYCFGRRPTPYSLFYLRSDEVLSKAGAQAWLRLEITPIVFDPPDRGAAYQFNQAIIDKRSAVAIQPDDVRISGVIWEYFNGLGWRQLEVTGSRNPFSCLQEGNLELRFQVPEDLQPTDVNADTGWYLRARVTEIDNLYSGYQRWIVPFVQGVQLQWQYEHPVPAAWLSSDNNGFRRELREAHTYDNLDFPLLEPLEEGLPAIYLRFDRSPHAMPLSLYFQVEGRAAMEEQLQWEWWNGKCFETVRIVDTTERLLHSGEMFLFLPDPLPERELFGETGCWLRLSRTGRQEGPAPTVAALVPNVVPAVQCRQEPEQRFDTGVYEAGKAVQLLSKPVQNCTVWVDELRGLSAAEAEALSRAEPDRVRLDREDHVLRHCWIRWEPVDDLALAGPGDRVYTLEPYEGVIRFGDGRRGRVPPAGDHNILVTYASGGGTRGNVPADTVRALLGGLPRISSVRNLTAMSGGTGRLSLEEIEARGSRHLRTRGRAAAGRDFEDLVRQAFPQVRHIRCFSGRDPQGQPKPGHVTVVLAGYGSGGEGAEALCRQVYDYLSKRCSCCLVAEGRLHVHPATVLTVNTRISVETEQPELAADTQQAIVRRVTRLIEETWHARPIGEQIRMDELFNTVRETPNVRLTLRILAEGAYHQEGQSRLAPLERDGDFPYAVVESGTHLVRVQ